MPTACARRALKVTQCAPLRTLRLTHYESLIFPSAPCKEHIPILSAKRRGRPDAVCTAAASMRRFENLDPQDRSYPHDQQLT